MGASSTVLRLSGDLSLLEQGLLGLLVVVTVGLLAFELSRAKRIAWWVFGSGVLGALLLAAAVARPVRVTESSLATGPRVAVLLDLSERLTLQGDDTETRRALQKKVLQGLREHFREARLSVFGFGSGPLVPLNQGQGGPPARDSALLDALAQLAVLPGERPKATVVVSDGRLTTPGPYVEQEGAAFALAVRRSQGEVPLHVVGLARRMPRDTSIRAVQSTGTAVAHQSFPLTIAVGCEPRAECDSAQVVVRELLENAEPEELGRGQVSFVEGEGLLELPIILERAGGRVLEVALVDAEADEVPANDRRFVPFEVRRDRMRILHVAGRPTYDVRALRSFLKSDESIDLVSFFILRTREDRVGAPDGELALIPFPVEELFTEHLPSFDAIVLQDIDARRYELDRHFPAIAAYVKKGGGLILVGGPGAFSAGGYANSPLEEVLPVQLPGSADVVDKQLVEPRYTPVGLVTPMLSGLRELLGNRLPAMVGSNRLGAPRPGTLVLWEHPHLSVEADGTSRAMPLLALAEMGDGRSIALGVDATHKLRFGELGAEAAGRGHSALWEGLLGWLMREPRYEAARIQAPAVCFAGRPFDLQVTALPGMGSNVTLELTPLRAGPEHAGSARPGGSSTLSRKATADAAGAPLTFSFEGVPAGAYVARAQVGVAPPVRLVFACEEGGGALRDSRPDPQRLAQLAAAGGGRFVAWNELNELPLPAQARVLTSSVARPLLPDWLWSLLAAAVLSGHWWLRRLGGYL